ncbi:MAG TPA: MBL fold metallo-hydrolase [Desulfomonilaceae bacterium]|nr:MBL fold metallo-hydrolase [Desulfomonilaceae bacterium]
MLVKFWGVHGSLPRPGPSTLKYGGNTACVEVRCGPELIVFDAGTGIRELGEDLVRRGMCPSKTKIKGHIFFSHLHWDHVQGFPFFSPIFEEGNEFHLYGGRNLNRTLYSLMSDQMAAPNFPVSLQTLAATLRFHDVEPGTTIVVDEARIRTERLNHPGGSLGYRLEHDGKVLVYASDTEHTDGLDPLMLEFVRAADALIYDSMFTPDQYLGVADQLSRQSWGHSTWEAAVELARVAGVKQLILFHHGNCDAVVADIESNARKRFPGCHAAYEGLEILL